MPIPPLFNFFQGTAVFWVLCSEQPQYTKKILSMHALAPIAYIHDMKSPLFRTLVLFLDFLTVSCVCFFCCLLQFDHNIVVFVCVCVFLSFIHCRPPHACYASRNLCQIQNFLLTTVRWCVTTMP